MITEHRYDSPSAIHKNIATCRKYYALQGRWSRRKDRLCNLVQRREFEVLYGFNPRCYHKPGWRIER